MSTAQAPVIGALQTALADHRAGHLLEAEEGYRRVLALDPDNFDARHLLGVVAHQLGRHADAARLIEDALARRPDDPAGICNLGEAYRALGRIDEAIACQRRALERDPGLAEAHNNLGLALQATGRIDEARASFERALARWAEYPDAELNLGNLLAESGRLADAVERFERVLSLAPHSAPAHYNLANALERQGLIEPAIAHYRHALAIEPGYVEAHNNLGLALADRGDLDAAVKSFEAALALDDRHAEASNNLGLALHSRGELAQARACFEHALELEPALAPAHNNLGSVLQQAGETAAAIAHFRRALELDPDYAEAHRNLGHALKDEGRLEDSIAAFIKAVEQDADDASATAQLFYQLQHVCEWPRLETLGARLDAHTEAALAAGRRPGETPFGSLARHADPARHFAIARAWARPIERRAARTGLRFAFEQRRRHKERLVIGYLSGDFRDHPIAHQTRRLFERHDRAAVEVRAYAHGGHRPTLERVQIAAASDAFVDLHGFSDADAAKRIHADGVDVLVDLTGFTRGNRIQIAALRPAPLQVGYLGLLGTTGGHFMDYLITDRVLAPPDEAVHFSERLVYLPECCLVFSEHGARPENRYRRSDFGLPDDGLVFVSLNASYKIEPVLFDVWMALLRERPDAVLWLYRNNEAIVGNLRREARRRGVEPQRLVFADRVPYHDNLARLQLADLGLDTRVYNGGLTTANALWAGVPVVTLHGTDCVSRMGASMLSTLDLPELIARSPEDYHARALQLASEPERLVALKHKLDDKLATTPLFDTGRFARHLEDAYRAMWQRFVAGDPPAPITVAPR